MLGGKPLIAYTIEAARASRFADNLICSTDDPEIAEVAKGFGCEIPFLRPPELASDTAKAIDVLKHAIGFMESLRKCEFTEVIYLEPPSPFRKAEDIDACVELFREKNPDSAVSVYEASHFHPAYMKKIENGLLAPYCMEEPEGFPRQLYEPKSYLRNGAVYVFRRDLILQGVLYGKAIVPYVMPWERSICIDDMLDWYAAEAVLKMNQEAGLSSSLKQGSL